MGLTESLVLSRRYCWISADFRDYPKLLFKFHSETKEMYLMLFSRCDRGRGAADIPWDLYGGNDQLVSCPSDEIPDFLRRFSPSNSLPNAVALQMTTDNLT